MEQGRFLTESENSHRLDVAVIGHDLAETLFPAKDAIGKELQVVGNDVPDYWRDGEEQRGFSARPLGRQAGDSSPISRT